MMGHRFEARRRLQMVRPLRWARTILLELSSDVDHLLVIEQRPVLPHSAFAVDMHFLGTPLLLFEPRQLHLPLPFGLFVPLSEVLEVAESALDALNHVGQAL